MRRAILAPWLALAVLASVGCTETVGFLSVDLQVPDWNPPITCAKDPRRAKEVRLQARCNGETIEASFAVDRKQKVASLPDVPLGSCEIKAEAINAYRRIVLSNKPVTVTISRGENEAVKIQLLEPNCDVACDPDQDGVPTIDELGLGLDPNVADSDRDGLSDGIELAQCCSDPRRPSTECKLLIKQVIPGLGPVGESVIVKATAQLRNPEVKLGSVPLDGPIADVTTVFGRVATRAVLGEVALASGGTTAVHDMLFAVLREDPQPVFEIDQKAGAKVGVMQQLVDLAQTKTTLFLLGRGADASVGTTSNRATGILIAINRQRNSYQRAVVSVGGSPIAVSANERQVAVLALEGTTTKITVYSVPIFPRREIKPLALASKYQPVSLLLLPDGKSALVLFSAGIVRVVLGLGSGVGPTPIPLPKPARSNPNSLRGNITCTGLAYDPGKGAAYASCNLQPHCGPGRPCPLQGQLLRVSPVSKCLPIGKTPSVDASFGCWSAFVSRSSQPLIGSPVIDTAHNRAYVLAKDGIFTAAIGDARPGPPRLLTHLIPFAWQGRIEHPKLMAGHAKGYLYVADGPIVRRLAPGAKSLGERLGRPFIAGNQGEHATMLAVSADASTIDIGRTKIATSLMSVCLQRCASCMCK